MEEEVEYRKMYRLAILDFVKKLPEKTQAEIWDFMGDYLFIDFLSQEHCDKDVQEATVAQAGE